MRNAPYLRKYLNMCRPPNDGAVWGGYQLLGGVGCSLAKEENTTRRMETYSENLELCHTSSSYSLLVFTVEDVISELPV